MHLENLKNHLRWLNGNTKEPNLIKLDKLTIEETIKEIEEFRYKMDNIKACLIGLQIYLESEDKGKQVVLSSINKTLRGIK